MNEKITQSFITKTYFPNHFMEIDSDMSEKVANQTIAKYNAKEIKERL